MTYGVGVQGMSGGFARVSVVGVDGRPLDGAARAALDAATLVVGGRTHLAGYASEAVEAVELGPLAPALDRLAAHAAAGGRSVVLASGDPGFFGIVRALRERGLAVAVFPASSSVQRLLAAVGRSWDDVTVVSAHGRALRPALNVCRARPAVAVLTAPGAGPAEIGAGLAGWDRTLVVGERLGAPDESVSTVDPATAAARTWREPNVVLCLAEPEAVPGRGWIAGGEPNPADGGWALPEGDFAHRDGMVTKSEVRALALAKLGPRPGALIWDVGAGSGAVAVECARFGAAVIAVERDPAQCARVATNSATHQVDVRVVPGAAPEALAGLPVPDAIFVGGGGLAVVETCAQAGAERVVVALASLDRVGPTRDALRHAGYTVDGAQLAVSRLADFPDQTSRLAAINPVFLLWSTPRPR